MKVPNGLSVETNDRRKFLEYAGDSRKADKNSLTIAQIFVGVHVTTLSVTMEMQLLPASSAESGGAAFSGWKGRAQVPGDPWTARQPIGMLQMLRASMKAKASSWLTHFSPIKTPSTLPAYIQLPATTPCRGAVDAILISMPHTSTPSDSSARDQSRDCKLTIMPAARPRWSGAISGMITVYGIQPTIFPKCRKKSVRVPAGGVNQLIGLPQGIAGRYGGCTHMQ